MAPSQKLTLMETTSTTETKKEEKRKPIISARFSIKADDLNMAHDFIGDLNAWLHERLGEQVYEGEEKVVGNLELTSYTVEINGVIYP